MALFNFKKHEMNKIVKPAGYRIDWPYTFLMGLILLGVLVIAGMVLSIIGMFF